MCSQGSESNNRWYSITMSSSVVPSEVVGVEGGSYSGISSSSGPFPPLESEITAVICPCHLRNHSRSTLSCLAHAGGAALAAPSCRVLGRDSDKASGCCPECLAMTAAGWVCSQGGESRNVWCLVAVPSFFFFPLPTPEVTEDGRPCLPLASEMTATVHLCCLYIMQEAPCHT